MSRLTLLLLVLACFKGHGQYISKIEFNRINELYITGQYESFMDKLVNLGFELDQVVKDYMIDGVMYKGQCTFILNSQAPWHRGLSVQGNAENKLRSFWKFETEEHDLFIIVKIRYVLYASNSADLFVDLKNEWERRYGPSLPKETTDCNSYHTDCARFIDRSENFALDLESGNAKELLPKFEAWIYYSENIRNGQDYGGHIDGTIEYYIAKHPLTQPISEYLIHREQNVKLSIVSVPIVSEGKIARVVVSIGGKPVSYIIDSGASDINISTSMEKYLKEIGVVRNTDYLSPQKYRMADGTIKEYRRLILSSVTIADISIESVTARVTEEHEVLLLGKSFLDRFSYWKINNQTQALELKK